jgi:hypothetical protein
MTPASLTCKKIRGAPFKPSFGLSGVVPIPLRSVSKIATYARPGGPTANVSPARNPDFLPRCVGRGRACVTWLFLAFVEPRRSV